MKDNKNKDEKKPNWKEKIKKVNWWMVLAIIAVVALLLSYAYRAQEAKLAALKAPPQCFNAPKGGNVVLTVPQGTLFPVMGKLRVSMPRRAVMLF